MVNNSAILTNGELAATIDKNGSICGLNYPYSGGVNHLSASNCSRIGIYCDGAIHWLNDGAWNIKSSYYPGRLILHTIANNNWLGLRLEFMDYVDNELNILSRNIHVINMSNRNRHLKLFLHLSPLLNGSDQIPDTASFLPSQPSRGHSFPIICHYQSETALAITGYNSQTSEWFDDYSIGRYGGYGNDYRDGVWCDASDGILAKNDNECGQVDSIIGFDLNILPSDSAHVDYFVSVATSTALAVKQIRRFAAESSISRTSRVNSYWLNFIKLAIKFASQSIPASDRYKFIDGIVKLRSSINNLGAPICQISVKEGERTKCLSCFTADYAADAVLILDQLNYNDEVLRIFGFISKQIKRDGMVQLAYLPNGSVGPSNSTAVDKNGDSLINANGIARMLSAFCDIAQKNIIGKRDAADWKRRWVKIAIPLADELSDNIDVSTKLPKPSRGGADDDIQTTTYTVGLVYNALSKTASLAELVSDTNSVIKYRTVVDDMRDNANVLWSSSQKYFYHGVVKTGSTKTIDETHDLAALVGVIDTDLFSQNTINQAIQSTGDDFDHNRLVFLSSSNGSGRLDLQLTVDLLLKIKNNQSARILRDILSRYVNDDSSTHIDYVTFIKILIELSRRSTSI